MNILPVIVSCLESANSGPSSRAASSQSTQHRRSTDEQGESFNVSTFFDTWFRTHGTPLFFLFKKNLKVTNIQFAELLALIRTYARDTERNRIDVRFVSSKDFSGTVQQMVDTFRRDHDTDKGTWKAIAGLYQDMLSRLVCVDTYFGSCAVFLPPGIKISLVDVCFRSGYIHSCGYNVFMRNTYKAKKDLFISRLRAHHDKHIGVNRRVLLRVYCHEDFTPYDRSLENALHAGLDDIKLHIGKTYMGESSLLEVLEELNDECSDRFIIPAPGDFHDSEKLLSQHPERVQSRCLFLIVDHGIGADRRQPSNHHYFICYDQLYINDSQLHLFDENKPAWIDHTTIPHTLVGAMINITRPQWPDKTVMLCDPFVGTGTTWLEAIKDHPKVTAVCQDASPFAPLLALNNIQFFALGLDDLVRCKDTLEDATAIALRDEQQQEFEFGGMLPSVQKQLRIAKGLCERSFQGYEAELHVVHELAESDLITSIFYYIWRRATVRHAPAVRRGAEDLRQAFISETRTMCYQISELISLRKSEQRPVLDIEMEEEVEHYDLRKLFRGTYSTACSVDLTHKYLIGLLRDNVTVRKVERLPPYEKYHVIVADPPYGFNTTEDALVLARTYHGFINRAIDCLHENGQLVLSLPDWSHTGRQLPYFTLKQIVAQQVLIAAEEKGREVLTNATAAPSEIGLFRAPYYWESERALRRAILHFRFGSRPS